MPSVPLKTSLGVQNMISRPDAHGTAQNVPGMEKHENGTRCPWYRRKRVRERKTKKMGVDALGTIENESWRATENVSESAVYPWKISKISSWVNENKYQLLIIKHKKEERERARERAYWSEEVANELRSNFICPTRKFWTQNEEYKYPTILYPLGMSDSREDQERREISRVSPCDYVFSDKWDPPGSPL
jgi:RNase H-fold protein (predicted Holliday junction resolvase)